MRGGVNMAVNWMGLDFMAGGVVRDMFRRSAWSAAVSFGLAQDHRN